MKSFVSAARSSAVLAAFVTGALASSAASAQSLDQLREACNDADFNACRDAAFAAACGSSPNLMMALVLMEEACDNGVPQACDDFATLNATGTLSCPSGGGAGGDGPTYDGEHEGDVLWGAISDPIQVTDGSRVTRDITSPRVGFYSFQMNVMGGQTVTLETTDASVDTICRLFDSNGRQIGYDHNGGNGTNCRIQRSNLASGDYFATVQAAGAQTGGFTFVLDQSAGGAGPVGNTDVVADDGRDDYAGIFRNISNPALVTSGSTLTREITLANGYYSFEIFVGAGQSISMHTTGDLDTVCRVFTDGGQQVGYSDDDGDGFNCSITTGALSAGRHLITVQGYGSSMGTFHMTAYVNNGGGTGQVTHYEDAAAAVWAATINRATVNMGDRLTRTISETGEFHAFAVQVGSGSSLTSQTTGTDVDTVCRIFDPNGVQVAYNDDGGDGLNCLVTASGLSGGQYTVVVQGYSGDVGTFTVDFNGGGGFAPTPAPAPSGGGTGFYQSGGAMNVWSSIQSTIDVYSGAAQSNAITTEDGFFAYRINVRQNGSLSAYTTGGVDTVCRIFDPGGIQMAFNDDGGEGLNCNVSASNLAAGNYVITVQGYSSSTGTFTLHPSAY